MDLGNVKGNAVRLIKMLPCQCCFHEILFPFSNTQYKFYVIKFFHLTSTTFLQLYATENSEHNVLLLQEL